MTIVSCLLTIADIEQLFKRSQSPTDINHPGAVEEIGICPIIELLELCELLRKGKSRLNPDSFRLGMSALQEGPIKRGEVVIVELDKERLTETLFEREGYIVTGLWSPAANHHISPTHSVRRLLLRPSDQTWWNGDIYANAEVIYSFIEEPNVDANV